MILYKKDELIYIEDVSAGITGKWISKYDFNYDKISSTEIRIVAWAYDGNDYKNFIRKIYLASEIKDRKGAQYGTTPEKVIFGIYKGNDVNTQDQTTDEVIIKFNQVTHSPKLAVAGSINDRTLTLTSAAGEGDGKYIILFHPESERFTTFTQIGAAVENVITIDGPLDFAYPVSTFVDLANTNLSVDGSSTPQVFGLRGIGAPPGVDIDFDMTRIMISCLTATAVDLSKFADISGGLTNGLVFRSRNERHHNAFNIKTNRDMDAIFGTDWIPYDAQNSNQGQHGFTARLTYAGRDKLGVAKRLKIGTDFQTIVQDPLQSITLLEIYAEGHITEP